jgi:ribosomal protein L11 methyltransferase
LRQAHNIAPRVVVYPLGAEPPALQEGWIALSQLPKAPNGRAVFGDGSHATTRLCAAAVDLFCRQHPFRAVLDVGTGTGVLARIARARGASRIVGTDIDPTAVSNATAQADLDGHPIQIHFGCEAPDCWGGRFDLVVANILAEPLLSLMPALARALAPGGALLVSGFTRPQTPALRAHYETADLKCLDTFHCDEWALLKFVRQS